MDLEIITTEDGSHSLFNRRLNEVYHSKKGALAESDHVFIRAGLEPACLLFEQVELLEVGFGTGLNTLLTAMHARESRTCIKYMALEPNPLPDPIVRKLNYRNLLSEDPGTLWSTIHGCGWETWQEINDNFSLLKVKATLEDRVLPANTFNLVYFDAFAPQVQPRLWQADLFEKLFNAMLPEGILVTYSAQGEVRRTLQKVGFTVERLPGPRGKREMLRARRMVSG